MPNSTEQNETRSELCNCPPEVLITLAMSIALAVSKGLTSDEINVLGDLVAIIGADLTLIADQLALCESSDSSNQSGGEQSGQQNGQQKQNEQQQNGQQQSGQYGQKSGQGQQNQKNGRKRQNSVHNNPENRPDKTKLGDDPVNTP